MDARRTPQSPGLPADKALTASTSPPRARRSTSATEVTVACAGPSASSDSADSDYVSVSDSEPAQQAAVPAAGDSSSSKSGLPLQLERVPQCAESRRQPRALLRWLAKLLIRGEEMVTSCFDEVEPWLKWKVYDAL